MPNEIKTKCAYLVWGNKAPIAHEALALAGGYRGGGYPITLYNWNALYSDDLFLVFWDCGAIGKKPWLTIHQSIGNN